MEEVTGKKSVVLKNKQHGKKRSSYKENCWQLWLCRSLQASVKTDKHGWGRPTFCGVFCAFWVCFLKNEHVATEGISCLVLFIAVRSRRYPICVKKDSVQRALVEEPVSQRCVLPSPPPRRETQARRTRGTCCAGARVTEGPVHGETRRKHGNHPQDPPEQLLACCCVQRGVTG